MLNKRAYFVNKIGNSLKELREAGLTLDEDKLAGLLMQEAEITRRLAKDYIKDAITLFNSKYGHQDTVQNTLS